MDDFIDKYITTESRKWLFCVIAVLVIALVAFLVIGIPLMLLFHGHRVLGGIILAIGACVGLGTYMYMDGVMD